MVKVWLNTFTKLREAKSISESVICICKYNIEFERDLIFFVNTILLLLILKQTCQ